jgi:hypothetical protein
VHPKRLPTKSPLPIINTHGNAQAVDIACNTRIIRADANSNMLDNCIRHDKGKSRVEVGNPGGQVTSVLTGRRWWQIAVPPALASSDSGGVRRASGVEYYIGNPFILGRVPGVLLVGLPHKRGPSPSGGRKDGHLDRWRGFLASISHVGFEEAVLETNSVSHHVLEQHAVEKTSIICIVKVDCNLRPVAGLVNPGVQAQRGGDVLGPARHQTGILAGIHFALECDDIGSGTSEIRWAHRIVMPKVVAFFENGGCLG